MSSTRVACRYLCGAKEPKLAIGTIHGLLFIYWKRLSLAVKMGRSTPHWISFDRQLQTIRRLDLHGSCLRPYTLIAAG
jgi:hypothetical protein